MALTSKKTQTQKPSRPDWQKSAALIRFIAELGRHGNVVHALKAAKLSRAWIYEKRQIDLEFASAFEEARRCGLEVLKDEAHRRAFEGIKEPVFYMGKRVAHVQKYSDTLLMFLVKQADPTYREHYLLEHANQGGRPFLFQMMLHPDASPTQK